MRALSNFHYRAICHRAVPCQADTRARTMHTLRGRAAAALRIRAPTVARTPLGLQPVGTSVFGSFRCFSSLAGARASVSVGCCQRVPPFSVLSLTAGRSSRYFSSPSPSPHASLTEPSVAVTESDVHISVCSAASISSGSPDPLAIVFLTEEQADTRFQQPLTLAWLPDEYASPTPSVLRDFLGKAGTLQSLYGKFGTVAPQRVVFVGLGPAKSLSLDALRMATHAAMTVCRDCKVQGASFYFSGLTSSSSPAVAAAVEAIVRTIILSNDAFDVHRKERSHRIKSVRIMLDTPAACSAPSGGDVASGSTEFAPDAAAVLLSQVERSVQNAKIVARATVFARYLANLRADVATPSFLERQAEMVSQAQSLPLTVVTETELRAQGLHLLASVGQAAQDHARLLVLEHRGNADDPEAWVALVGKGITFDTGGLNLKTGDSMYDMHLDMSGAAAVLATVQAVAKLGLRLNVVGVLAVAENAINNRALRPRSILPSAKGSVEVSNTDAEGRLALADAFVYAQKRYSPFQLIDLATLTGAVVRALGEQTAGLFSNDAGLSAQLIQAGISTYERCWPMPVLKEHIEELKGTHSDWKTIGSGNAGASIAAAFLSIFVEKNVKWAHIDIAGSAMYSKPRAFIPKGGTGFGVALLCEHLRALAMASTLSPPSSASAPAPASAQASTSASAPWRPSLDERDRVLFGASVQAQDLPCPVVPPNSTSLQSIEPVEESPERTGS